MKKSFYSVVAKKNYNYWGITPKGSYFQFKNEEQTLIIRFDDREWEYGLKPTPTFVSAELTCNRTGDIIEFKTVESLAKKLLNNFGK
jgi:hypothetical protein